MRVSRIDINRDECILQVVGDSPVSVINAGVAVAEEVVETTLELVTPVCKDGVCSLGEWKPNRQAA